jgi:hypothetical protein
MNKNLGNRTKTKMEGTLGGRGVVFGGVEVGGGSWGNNKYFCIVVENCTTATLLPLIRGKDIRSCKIDEPSNID